jgi:hypothetical protein
MNDSAANPIAATSPPIRRAAHHPKQHPLSAVVMDHSEGRFAAPFASPMGSPVKRAMTVCASRARLDLMLRRARTEIHDANERDALTGRTLVFDCCAADAEWLGIHGADFDAIDASGDTPRISNAVRLAVDVALREMSAALVRRLGKDAGWAASNYLYSSSADMSIVATDSNDGIGSSSSSGGGGGKTG